MKKIKEVVQGKNVLFISTKNKDYIRNVQEIKLLKENANTYEEIVFEDKSYLKRIIKVYLNCLFKVKKNIDIIYVGFAPQLVFPLLFFWNKKKVVLIDFFISLYDTFVCDRNYFSKNSILAKTLHWIDRFTLKNCKHVVVDTQAHGIFFQKEFGVNLDKIEVLYLEADKKIYDAQKYTVQKNRDIMSVLYFGSVLPLQGVDVILDAIKLLRKIDNIQFIMVGPIKNIEKVKKDYPNTSFYNWLSQEELAEKIANADLCLAGHFNGEVDKAKRTIAGKTYIYEAMNKRIILGENTANRELFVEDDRHFFVEMGNAKVLADKIFEIMELIKNEN